MGRRTTSRSNRGIAAPNGPAPKYFQPSADTVLVSEARFFEPTSASGAFQAAIRDALHRRDFSAARTIVAEAEASSASAGPLDHNDLVEAKARIAVESGDAIAARAILIAAIEQASDPSPLRRILTEVMMAEGQATNVRPVLKHLGHTPDDLSTPGEMPSPKQTGPIRTR